MELKKRVKQANTATDKTQQNKWNTPPGLIIRNKNRRDPLKNINDEEEEKG